MAGRNAIQVDASEMAAFKKEMQDLQESLDRKKINQIQTRNARPMLADMRMSAPSTRIAAMTAITTRQSKRPRAPRIGIRIGVINNDAGLFPTLSAPALASVLEHGTDERFRTMKKGGFITGRQSTGSVTAGPWLRRAWDRNVHQFISKTIKSYEAAVNG